MTPRERLEAAGWTYRRTIFYKVSKWVNPKFPDRFYDEREALEILARDEAKETSVPEQKGRCGCFRDGCVDCAEPDVAPVATSVSAPPTAEQFWDAQLGVIRGRPQVRRPFTIQLSRAWQFAEAYAREYASSSSAAPKWDENGILWWAGIGHISVFQRNQDVRKIEAERDALRDSRDRLQEALKGYRENHRSHGCHGRGTDPFISTACAMCCKADAALGDPKKENGL